MKSRLITEKSVTGILLADGTAATGRECLDRTRVDRIFANQRNGHADELKAAEIENIKLRKQVGELVTQILALRERLRG
jgi:hypothetical protein